MDLSTAQKMIRHSYALMCGHYGVDQMTELQEFLSGIDSDFLLTELEDFVAAKLDAKLEPHV